MIHYNILEKCFYDAEPQYNFKVAHKLTIHPETDESIVWTC